MKTIFKIALVMAVGFASNPRAVLAQHDYPNKPIRFVVPFPAGGGLDSVARTLAEKLTIELHQPLLIDNRGGAGGSFGTSLVANAPPDGYTMLYTNNGQAIIPNVQKTNWDPMKDFKGVSNVVVFPMMIFVNANSPLKSLSDLISAAKAQPGKLSYASSGVGSPLHIGMEMFRSAAGIDIMHVPYKGNGPMTTALLGNEVSMSLDSLAVSMPQVKAGKFRALALTSLKRLPTYPDVPAIAEWVPGYEYDAWHAVFVPAGTPSEIIAKLNATLVKVIAMPEVSKKIVDLGFEPKSSTPAELDTMVSKDMSKFRKIVQDANIKAE